MNLLGKASLKYMTVNELYTNSRKAEGQVSLNNDWLKNVIS